MEFIPGDSGDARFINFILEHGYQWLQGHNASFWDANFMYPFQNTVGLSDNMLGTMPVYSCIRFLGFEQETAYQLWWIIICSLNFWSAYYIVYKWLKRKDLALVAAWIFAFSIYNLGQINYLQMMIRFMVPVVLFAAARLVETGKVKYYALFTLGLVYQFYCVIYTGLFLFYFSLAFIIVYSSVLKRHNFFITLFNRMQILYTLGVSFLGLVLMLILSFPYYEMSSLIGYRNYEVIKWNIPLIKSYLYPQEASLTWKYLVENCRPEVEKWWLHQSFPGMIPLITLIAAPFLMIYWKLKRIQVQNLTIALIITSLLILIFFVRTNDGESLFSILVNLPGMRSLSVINRFMHAELFIIILILVKLLESKSFKYGLIILGLTILDNSFNPERVIRYEKEKIMDRRLHTISEIQKQVTSEHLAFVIIDKSELPFNVHLDAMIASNYLDIPTINGYSSTCPRQFGSFFNYNTFEGLSNWLKYNDLKRNQILIIERK